MAVAPKNLILQGKTDPQAPQFYKTDMRTIEQWCNQLKVGNTSVGGFGYQMGPPSAGAIAAWMSGTQSFSGTTTPQTVYPVFGGNVGWPPADFITTSIVFSNFGGGFFYVPAAAGTKVVAGVSTFFAPQFIGPSTTISARVSLSAVAVTGVAPASNSLTVTSHTISLVSGQTRGLGAADYLAATINGADLTFTTGAIRSTGGTIPYIVGWDVFLQWDTANTYGHP